MQQVKYVANASNFAKIPGSPIAYWVGIRIFEIYSSCRLLGNLADVRHGLSTGKNEWFVREWYEVDSNKIDLSIKDRADLFKSKGKWFPYNKGGDYRKWYGNTEHVLWYDFEGQKKMAMLSGHRHDGKDRYFKEGVTWSFISSSNFGVRYSPSGFIFDVAGSSMFLENDKIKYVVGLLCSKLGAFFMKIMNPTLNFQVGNLKNVPIIIGKKDIVEEIVNENINREKQDWDSFETSWDFKKHPLI